MKHSFCAGCVQRTTTSRLGPYHWPTSLVRQYNCHPNNTARFGTVPIFVSAKMGLSSCGGTEGDIPIFVASCHTNGTVPRFTRPAPYP